MSINVTINGNSLNVYRGRMALSDLNQIKKNERDRRRRLRLEQVRQQSKEMSDKLLERTKNIAKEELKKLEDNEKSNVKQIHNERIMKVQQKYNADMADIGHAHTCAELENINSALTNEQVDKNNLTTFKKEKKIMKLIDRKHQETAEQLHQERLREVRDMEDVRSKMIAKLYQNTMPVKQTACNSIPEERSESFKQPKSVKKKIKNFHFKKSPRKMSKSCIKTVGSEFKTHSPLFKLKPKHLKPASKNNSPVPMQKATSLVEASPTSDNIVITETAGQCIHIPESEFDNNDVRKAMLSSSTIPIKNNRTARYDPEDYTQRAMTYVSNDSSRLTSDDSSYFSDSKEQFKHVRPSLEKNNRQQCDEVEQKNKLYKESIDRVEKIHTWNEPSAIDLAQNIEQVETNENYVKNNHEYCTRIRGEDAVLREKVRRDYKTLMQNLHHLTREERQLKASQTDCYPETTHAQERRRKTLREQHKKKLDRALRTLLSEEHLEQCHVPCPMREHVTLTPREHYKTDMHNWNQLYCSDEHTITCHTLPSKDQESEHSREEQILNMLQKVEKQKQLLLQEFGTDLPTDILNASMKHFLSEKENSIQVQSIMSQDAHVQKALAPEIKVIDAGHNEDNEKNKIGSEDDSSQVKVEAAVQTVLENKINVVQDKCIQVEIAQRKINESISVDDDVEITTKHYPLEPKITVIAPENDSIESTTSTLTTSTAIDTNKDDSEIIFQRKETNTKTFIQIPPQTSKKSTSAPASRISSGVKKLSKSLNKSRYSNLKKVSCNSVDKQSNKIKIYIDENGFNIKVKPRESAEVALDVSTQSSELHLVNTQDRVTSNTHWARTQTKDATDTSTSFASPPPIKARDVLEVLNNNVSILEMLDSSTHENMLFMKGDISPVSTPETPSPRTMKMPSNVPHTSKFNKFFKYESTDSQISENSTLTPIKNDHSASKDLPSNSKQLLVSEICLCKNPECKLRHTKLNDICNYALKSCPQILQKYENLQSMCAKRIVSLTRLIEKIRSEQEGMESSTKNEHDETSFLQLSPKIMVNDLQSVHKLVENIEAIHNQLAKTLIESQKIIKHKTISDEEGNQDKKIEAVSTKNGSVATVATNGTKLKIEVPKAKIKPKIISDEKVNIQLDRFQIEHKPQTLKKLSVDHNQELPLKLHGDKMIEELSKEILEQSAGFNNNLIGAKEIVKSTVQRTVQTSTDSNDFKYKPSAEIQRNSSFVEKREKLEKIQEFVPLLADIPKVSKATENTGLTARNKPPVSLLCGPYRAEIESSGHELSTIIEFDTLDTMNKSQKNINSPSIKRIGEAQVTTSTISVQPLQNVNSLLRFSNERFEKIHYSPTTKASSEIPEHIEKTIDIAQVTNSQLLQSGAVGHELLQMEESRPVSLLSTNISNHKNNDKLTSISSNSVSGLSGISQIASTPSSDILKPASSPEEMEIALKKLGLGWALTTLKKTREASALSSSSNSDVTPVNPAKRLSMKKSFDNNYALPDFSDVSSITIRESSKGTEQALLLKGRTSTPKLQHSNSNSLRMNSSNTNISGNFQEPSNDLKVPNISLAKTKCNNIKIEEET